MHTANSYQKQALRAALVQRGWEIVDTQPGDVWWKEEEWLIQSLREAWGFNLKIIFRFVDLPASHVDAIEAHPASPDQTFEPVYLSYRRHFDDELSGFLDRLDVLRRPSSPKRL